MKDYRIPVSVAIPATIGLLGVLWLLRKKSSPSDRVKKASVPKEEKHLLKWNDKTQLEQLTQNIEEKGTTVSQRKIPENQARDRGSSDISQNLCDLSKVRQDEITLCSGQLDVKSSIDSELGPAETSVTQCGQGDSLASSQRVHIEHLVTTAMGDGLREAHIKLVKVSSNSQPLSHQISLDAGESDQSVTTEHAVENTVCEKISTLVDVDLSDLKLTKSVNNVNHCPHLTHASTVSLEDLLSTLDPSVCDKTVEICGMDSDAVLLTNEQETAAFLQQTTFACSSLPQMTLVTSSDTDCSASSKSATANHSQIKTDCSFSKVLAQVDNEESCSINTNEPELASDVNNHMRTSSSVEGTIFSHRVDPDKSNINLPCDWHQESNTWMSTTSSACTDIHDPERLESIWTTTPSVDTNLNTPVDTYLVDSTLDAGNSLLDQTNTSCDPNSDHDITSPTRISFSENHECAADSFTSEHTPGCDNTATALSNKSIKEDSPVTSNSPACDSNSEGSNDSGRGGSEHDVVYQACETLVHFEFNMPSDLCGRFIGKHGKNINYLKNKTGAHVSLSNSPFTPDYQICQVVGNQSEVDDALAMIRRKFPVQDYPLLTMMPVNMSQQPVIIQPEHQLILPEVMQLSLPEGVSVDVFVSAIVDAGHLFVQQPTHRSFMSLEKLNYFLNLVYSQDPNVPCVPSPVESGIICVCENDGFWYRAMIMSPEDENGDSQVKFVDYGGYAMMAVSSLKQIRADFMSLPFQAVECFMANVTPNQNEQLFSNEATLALSEITQGKLLQCQVVARVENGAPYIHLYQISTESNSAVMINRALVNRRLVRWIEIL